MLTLYFVDGTRSQMLGWLPSNRLMLLRGVTLASGTADFIMAMPACAFLLGNITLNPNKLEQLLTITVIIFTLYFVLYVSLALKFMNEVDLTTHS